MRTHKHRLFVLFFTSLLIGIGLGGDLLAGYMVIGEQEVAGAILHLAAISVWVGGILALSRQCGPTSYLRGWSFNGETTVFTLLGLLLFPGLGSLAITAGLLIASLAIDPKQQGKRVKRGKDESSLLPKINKLLVQPVNQGTPIVSQPLEELFNCSDLSTIRRGLEMICRNPHLQAATLVRRLLHHPNLDIRSLAAVTISRLEAHFNNRFSAALEQCELEPLSADNHYVLGSMLVERAESASGNPNRNLYLVQARTALEHAVELEPHSPRHLTLLAQVLIELGEYQAAHDLITWLLADPSCDANIYKLAMTLAFKQQHYDEVRRLARQASLYLHNGNNMPPLVKWWLEPDSKQTSVTL